MQRSIYSAYLCKGSTALFKPKILSLTKNHYNNSAIRNLRKGRLSSYHPGLFPKTGAFVSEKEFSFVYLDVDVYQSTKESLEFFYPRMTKGGIILSHDYQYPGVRQAFKVLI
ncbi:MAG: hypothetical protein GY832_24910 [Chloroflexi bacterium]|nr:hypothetical protein [Chloroflexota bacterium]